jgi:hypothetical protein
MPDDDSVAAVATRVLAVALAVAVVVGVVLW